MERSLWIVRMIFRSLLCLLATTCAFWWLYLGNSGAAAGLVFGACAVVLFVLRMIGEHLYEERRIALKEKRKLEKIDREFREFFGVKRTGAPR